MEGWKEVRIGDLFDIKAGGDLQEDCYSPCVTNEARWAIYANSLENKGLYGYTSRPRFHGNAVTITGRGDIGHAEYREEDFDAIVRLLVLLPKEYIDCRYITYYLNSIVHFPKESTGVPQLTAPKVKRIKINLPQSKAEQTAIANILAKVDEAIESVQNSIAKAERLKKSLMQNLLTGKMKPDGTFRTSDEFYIDEKFGKVPVGWEIKRIDELTRRKTEVIDPTKTKEIYDYIGLEHVVSNEFVRNGKGLSNETVALKVKFERGDILYGKLRPYLNKVLIADITGVGSTEFIVLEHNIYSNWIYLNFQLQRFFDFEKYMTAGTQHPRASWNDIRRYPICLPKDLQEMKLIAEKIISLESFKFSQLQETRRIERLKKSLMQNLLTGKIRITI